jgi:pSer/pThr/pTyr-binding forkhead associated (FHA) protein
VVALERQSLPALFLTEPAEMKGRVIVIEQPILVGRGAEADVTLDDPFISDLHVRFDRLENRLVLEDLGSTNGIAVMVYRCGRRVLDRGDVIRIGQTMEVR